jgi:hypothetical protein
MFLISFDKRRPVADPTYRLFDDHKEALAYAQYDADNDGQPMYIYEITHKVIQEVLPR